MAEIMETVMLVCFGISWPMNVVKNYRAATAKGMSLSFTLLIILGYVAGISAKALSGAFNYVLLVYLLNLAMVSLNIVIYIRNRRLDMANAEEGAEARIEQPVCELAY